MNISYIRKALIENCIFYIYPIINSVIFVKKFRKESDESDSKIYNN